MRQYCFNCKSEQEVSRGSFIINGKHSHYIITCNTCNRKLLDEQFLMSVKQEVVNERD